MYPSTVFFAGAFVLTGLAAAAPTSNSMTLHWLHNKRTNTVAIDVGAGDGSSALLSHQFCGSFSPESTINWDAFAQSPLSVKVDQNGLGTIDFGSQTFDTTPCVAMYDDGIALLSCTMPFSAPVPNLRSRGVSAACISDSPDLLATLSPIYRNNLLDMSFVQKREPEAKVSEVQGSVLQPRNPQVEPSCYYNRCTVQDSNLGQGDTSYQVQISPTNTCGDGTCGASAGSTKSQSISFNVNAAVNEWINGGFSVSESYSTTGSVNCNGSNGQTVCVWTGIPHKAYNVDNAECSTCGGDSNRSGSIRMKSPFTSDSAYCVRNACRSEGQGYYPAE